MCFVLRNLTQMLLSRWRRFGYVCVNFGTPISTIAYSKKHQIIFKNLPRQQRFPEIKKLCDTLMNKISDVVPIVPVSLLFQFFLENLDKELTFLDIENGCGSILQKINGNGALVI
ncbi:MAG: hypothetical protein KAH62_00195 [Desulfobacula sp.]|nr:hypothetical protein [Desulfobacula sp.]